MPETAALPFDAALFDCDGVLVDSERITSTVLRGMLHELGWQVSAADCFRFFVGRALRDEAAVITAHTAITVTDEWLGDFRRRRGDALMLDLLPILGAVAAVQEVDRIYRGNLACASGADRSQGRVAARQGRPGHCVRRQDFQRHGDTP